MRPVTGTSKMRRLSAILSGSIAVLSLTACAADQTRMGMLSPPPYLALNSGAMPRAVAEKSGYFSEEHGCLVFRPAQSSQAMVPVFRAGTTALATDGSTWLGLFVHDEPVAMGKAYRVTGADAAAAAPLSLTTAAPAGCPSQYFVVSSVGQTLADADAQRFCSGVILCTSYDVD